MSLAQCLPPFHAPLSPALIDQVCDSAYVKLGDCGGRLAKAAALVRNGDVTLLPQGYAEVRSQSNPLASYSVNGSCACDDAKYRAPDGRCKHLLAALLMRKMAQLHPQAANDPTPAPVLPLPEAPCSVNTYVTIGGRQVQVTLRGHEEGALLARLAALLDQYPVSNAQPLTGAPSEPVIPAPTDHACPLHGVVMAEQHNTKGSWYSHRLADGAWCKGKTKGGEGR